MDYENSIVYLNGRYLERHRAAISPDDRGFLLGDGVYEVIRASGGRLFEGESHFERLERSLSETSIRGVDTAVLEEAAVKLIRENGLSRGQALIYMQITRGAAPRTHAFPVPGVSPTVYAFAVPFEPQAEAKEKGIGIILTADNRWDRCDIKSVSLIANVLAKQKAEESGAGEAVFTREGVVTEGTASNFAAVFSGTLLTHPEGSRILSSITRKVVIRLCGEIGIPFELRAIGTGELDYAEEMMVMSTTKDVMPVVSFDGKTVSGGKPGPVTRKLQEAFDRQLRE